MKQGEKQQTTAMQSIKVSWGGLPFLHGVSASLQVLSLLELSQYAALPVVQDTAQLRRSSARPRATQTSRPKTGFGCILAGKRMNKLKRAKR